MSNSGFIGGWCQVGERSSLNCLFCVFMFKALLSGAEGFAYKLLELNVRGRQLKSH